MTKLLRLQGIALFVLFAAAWPTNASEPQAQRPNDDVILLEGKQLFIDNYIIDEMRGVTKVLNRPVKHPDNPLAVPDLGWEDHGFYANGTVIYDEQEVFYDVGIRLKGSERGRVPDVRRSFSIDFQPDRLFRGVQPTIAVDRSGAGEFRPILFVLDRS